MRAARFFWAVLMAVTLIGGAVHALDIRTAVLRVDYPTLVPISRYDLKPDDLGFAGAFLANEDNQTTGSFLGLKFETEFIQTPPEEAAATMARILGDGYDLIVVLANSEDTLALADQAGEKTLVFNALARRTSLRDDECRANLLHTAPSYAMIADAVTQFTMWKKWSRWFLIEGSNPADLELGAAFRASARKFGAKIVEDRTFEDTGGSRRTDTGHVLVQRQIPTFTQRAAEHDVIVAADESNVFALYLPYHTWEPRPVMGSAGLRPVTFHGAHEAWGATQVQRRFEKHARRYIQEADFQAWLALRVLGEAVIRTNSNDPASLKEYILSDKFELAAFQGQKVTFRSWNGQLRQSITLTDSKVTVSVSPQDGYLHRVSLLDTLGLDEPESDCTAFKG